MGTGAKALFLVLIQEARQSGGYEPTSIFNFLVRWNHRSLYEVLTLLGDFHGPGRLVSGRGMCFLLEFRCHAQLKATPQFGMADIPSLNIVGRLCI